MQKSNKKQLNMAFENDYRDLITSFNAECADEDKRTQFVETLNMMIMHMINRSVEE